MRSRIGWGEAVRSGLEQAREEDLAGVSDLALESRFADLEGVSRAAEAERLRTLAEIDRRRMHTREGHASAVSWAAARSGVSFGRAAHQVRVARALEEMPETQRALARGEVSPQAVEVLVAARDGAPDAFWKAEPDLVEAARTRGLGDLRGVTDRWRRTADPGLALEEAEEHRRRRRLRVFPTLEGMVRVDGDLDPETGEEVLTALRAVQDAEPRNRADRRTSVQRRADALGEICRRFLGSPHRSTVGRERPHVTVTVDLEALGGRPGGRSELAHAGPVHPEVARRLACDASVTRVVTRGDSEPLDVGRRTPVVPAGLRRAVAARDGHCRFPGCDRPPGWCDAHHVVHWAEGGPTALSNLVLLCRTHHRLVHEPGGFRLGMSDGRPTVRRRDGSILEERAPP